MWEKRKHSLSIFCVGAIFLILNPEQCLSYKIFCDEGWVGFSESPSCYRFITEKLETYQSAKDVCENYDGFPLVIDSVPEKVNNFSFLRENAWKFSMISRKCTLPP